MRIKAVNLRHRPPVDHRRRRQVMAQHRSVVEARGCRPLVGDNRRHRRSADGIDRLPQIGVAAPLAVPVGPKVVRIANGGVGFIEAVDDINSITVMRWRGQAAAERMIKPCCSKR
jgi:hypothetical protein